MRIEQESIEHRRATCKIRNRLEYCNVPDEDCPKCKAYDYEPANLIVGLTWEQILNKQQRK